MANNFHLSESELDLEVQKCNKDNKMTEVERIEIKYLAQLVCLTSIYFFLPYLQLKNYLNCQVE
jgi:hypothetical protein